MGGFYRKSEAGLVIIVIVLLVILFLGWVISISQRECRSNKDCNPDSYCGSDFACHPYPNIQKTVVQYSLVRPSLIIGLAIIVAAIILKWSKNTRQENPAKESKPRAKPKEEIVEEAQPYYKSDSAKTH